MAFADPAAMTVAGVAKSLPRTGSGDDSSEYVLVDTGNVKYTLTLSHQFKARNRCVARLTKDSLINDPLVTGQTKPESQSVTVTFDFSALHTATDAQVLFNALITFLTSANALRLAAGET